MKPEMLRLEENVVDVILVVHMANMSETSSVIKGYQDAFKSLAEIAGENVNLQVAVVKYGYQITSSSAAIVQDFSTEFPEVEMDQEEERCASPQDKLSGMGKALAEVTSLTKMRPNACKVCVMTSKVKEIHNTNIRSVQYAK